MRGSGWCSKNEQAAGDRVETALGTAETQTLSSLHVPIISGNNHEPSGRMCQSFGVWRLWDPPAKMAAGYDFENTRRSHPLREWAGATLHVHPPKCEGASLRPGRREDVLGWWGVGWVSIVTEHLLGATLCPKSCPRAISLGIHTEIYGLVHGHSPSFH